MQTAPEVIDRNDESVPSVNTKIIEEMTGAEVDKQIATAHAFPRDEERWLNKCKKFVALDLDTAKSMQYVLERKDPEAPGGKKLIPGPTVRFAEIIAQQWGNLRVGARVIDVGHEWVTGWGMAWDLETNFAQFRERKGRITTKTGHRYGTDMIVTAQNAATSIAYREAILKTIPKALWNGIYMAAVDVILGPEREAAKLRKEWTDATGFFTKRGVTVEQILVRLGIGGENEVTGEHILLLAQIYTDIKEKKVTVKQAFAPPEPDVDEKKEAKQQQILDAAKDATAKKNAGTDINLEHGSAKLPVVNEDDAGLSEEDKRRIQQEELEEAEKNSKR